LICNHGLLARYNVENKASQIRQGLLGGWTPGEASESFYGNILGGGASCLNCGANLLEDILEVPESSGIETQRQANPCEQMVCAQCNSQTSDDKIGQSPWYSQDLLDSSESSAPASPMVDLDVASTIESMSTKIKFLVADLDKHSSTEKRSLSTSYVVLSKWLTLSSVVFSYWTNTLDLVQLMLDQTRISYTRIDGKTSLPRRSEALRAFQNDDSVRVILVSITCGGAGWVVHMKIVTFKSLIDGRSLDLTSGSRAYLLEPQWNPMTEEQALCRVHRVGQKRDVTTIRYLMRDSFEEVSHYKLAPRIFCTRC